jgi:hypothetical protein
MFHKRRLNNSFVGHVPPTFHEGRYMLLIIQCVITSKLLQVLAENNLV